MQSAACRAVVLALVAGCLATSPGAALAVATPQPPLVQVDTQAGTPGAYGIQVGPTFYQAPGVPGGQTPGLQVLALSSADLSLVWNHTYCTTCSAALGSDLGGLAAGTLVLVASQPGFGDWGELNTELPAIGTVWNLLDHGTGGTYGVIGAKGLVVGRADQRSGATGEMVGYLTPDQSYRYGFAAGDPREYQLSADGHRLTLNGQDHVLPSPGGDGGFSVWAVDAQTMAPLPGFPRAYATSQSDGPTARDEQRAMGDALTALAGNPNALVFVKSYGNPVNYWDLGAWTSLASGLAAVGGTGHNVNAMGDGPYMLVGWGGASRADGVESLRAGTPHGILLRDHSYRLRPALNDPVGTLNFDLLRLAFREPEPSHWPDQGTPAYTCVSEQVNGGLGGPDLRFNYWFQTAWDWDQIWDEIGNVTTADCPSVDATALTDMKTQLQQEVIWVGKVRAYLQGEGAQQGLDSPFANGAVSALADIQTFAAQVKDDVEVPGSADTTSEVLALVEGIGNVAWAVAAPEFAPAIGTVTSVFTAAATIGQDSDTGGSLADPFTVQADQFAATMMHRFADAQTAFRQVGDMIVADYDKLQTVGTYAMCTPGATGCTEEWQWSGSQQAAAAQALETSVKRAAANALIPLKYQAVDVSQYRVDDAKNLFCYITFNHGFRPFQDAPTGATFTAFTIAGGLQGGQVAYGMSAGDINGGPGEVLPKALITQNLFTPVSSGGLGLDPAGFYLHTLKSRTMGCQTKPPPPPGTEPPTPAKPIESPSGPVAPAPAPPVAHVPAPARVVLRPASVTSVAGRPVALLVGSTHPGRVEVRVRRNGRTVATLHRRVSPGRTRVHWDGRERRRGHRRAARPGTYRVEVVLRTTDGRTVRSHMRVRLTRRR